MNGSAREFGEILGKKLCFSFGLIYLATPKNSFSKLRIRPSLTDDWHDVQLSTNFPQAAWHVGGY
jgi:hypothetical protein